jgi:quinoprotein glucose dehydrogenase
MQDRRSLFSTVMAILLALCGLALLVAGVGLISVGGSWYYAVCGVLLLLDAWLLFRGAAVSLWLFAALLAGTLVWALWEAGLDWWPLAARLDVLFVLGVLLWLPWATRGFDQLRSARSALLVVLAASVVVAVASWVRDPHDIEGVLPSHTAATTQGGSAGADWVAYGGTGLGQRYSALAQITPANVTKLQEVWHFHTGDVRGQPGDPEETTYEVTPLKIGNRLLLCTPHQNVIALDATTGQQLWRYEPKLRGKLALQHLTCRGLSWQPPEAGAASAATGVTAPPSPPQAASGQEPLPIAAQAGPNDATCASKLFMPTDDGRVIALNPDDGHVCTSFGGGTGQIDLWQGMPNFNPGSYYSTSPVIVTRKLLIVAGTVLDNVSTHEQSGVIRAYDVDTGHLVWNWDSGNPDDTAPLAPGKTYVVNSPNSWSVGAVDENLGLVYFPMGNQPPDQWGANRSAAVEKYSSSVVALDLATGKVRWSFQTVHHDLWDYDVPSQPSLVDLKIGTETVPALVQPTKQGELFVLDRRTGKPVLPVSEQRAPDGAVQGDHTSPTQPRSAISFDPEVLSGKRMWGATMFDQLYCRVAFHRLHYEGRFTPPSLEGSLIYPGNFGVFNWGSIAVDPTHGIAFTTPDYLAFISQLIPRPNDTALVLGKQPKGSLPALNENFGAPYAIKLAPFESPLGIPCQQPPWGYVAGVDLSAGKIVWRHRNGTVRDLAPVPLPFRMGVPNLGGPIVTAGGVAFLSGSLDYYVRAYDVTTGKVLWHSRLPAGGQATPMTYQAADGRQFVLVVAGGHGSTGTKPGDSVIAYALPK